MWHCLASCDPSLENEAVEPIAGLLQFEFRLVAPGCREPVELLSGRVWQRQRERRARSWRDLEVLYDRFTAARQGFWLAYE